MPLPVASLAGLALAGLAASVGAEVGSSPPPRAIIHILLDDFGWADAGFHNNNSALYPEVQTANMDKLALGGIQLDNHYVFKYCSPSRCALQSGRNPIHVNVQNVPPENHNPDDPVGGFQGIPINMTGVGEKMQQAGYTTHLVGKWDVGMATPLHTPSARGYHTWLGYWHHSNDYWSHGEGTCDDTAADAEGGRGTDDAVAAAAPRGTSELVRDLWRFNISVNATGDGAGADLGAPAYDLQNPGFCSQAQQHNATSNATCVFEEQLLADRVVDIIHSHGPGGAAAGVPLFLVWSSHLVHMPLEAPDAYVAKFVGVKQEKRRLMRAMANYLDDAIGRMVDALEATGLMNDTLIVAHSDNGGEIMGCGMCGGNNWPMRGGKFSNWQGGIKTVAFVAGGFVPPARRGTVSNAHITAWDWYATYCDLVGVSADDPKAAAAGLPAVDGVAQWAFLSGANATPPRDTVLIGDTGAKTFNGDGDALVGGVVRGDMKLLVGAEDKDYRVDQDVLTAPLWPAEDAPLCPLLFTRRCTRDPKHSCLFNLTADPTETTSIAEDQPALFAEMLALVDAAQATVYSPDRGKKDPAACAAAKQRKFYWGPWLPAP